MSGDHLPCACSLRVNHGTAQGCRVTCGDHTSEYDRRITDNFCVEANEMGIGEHRFAAAGLKEVLSGDDVIVRRSAGVPVVNDLILCLAIAFLICFQPLLLDP